jgi:hypothetical protein
MIIVFSIFILFMVLLIVGLIGEIRKRARMSPEEKAAYLATLQEGQRAMQLGPKNSAMICPHCQTKGSVRTKQVDRKKGVSGGKATAALLTGGVSVLATGLSRKETWTHAKCEQCNCEWDF